MADLSGTFGKLVLDLSITPGISIELLSPLGLPLASPEATRCSYTSRYESAIYAITGAAAAGAGAAAAAGAAAGAPASAI